MLKLFGLLAVVCLGSCQVSGQSAAVSTIRNAINTFRISNLNTLTNQYNNLRDDVYGHFYRSQNIINDAQNNLFNAGQKMPYYSLSDLTVRNDLSGNITNFMNNCTRPAIQYLHECAILPMFNFTANNTTPMEIAFKPINDALHRVEAAVASANNDTCLSALRINAARLRNLFGDASNQINGCIRTTFTAYRTPISQFTSMHFSSYGQLNSLVNDVQSCSSVFGNRTACAIRVSAALCSSPTDTTCQMCGSLQKLKAHSMTMIEQTQEIFNVCLHNTASHIANTDSLFQDIASCYVAPSAADEEYYTTTELGVDDGQANQVIDSKVDEFRKNKDMNLDESTGEKDHFDYGDDYLTIY